MTNNWEYASVGQRDRLKMIRNGNKDVFDNEILRAKDVIKSRLDLGLDIDEQKNWIDTLGYNYNLYNAKNMGIDPENVNKTGYADEILGTREKKVLFGLIKKQERFFEITTKGIMGIDAPIVYAESDEGKDEYDMAVEKLKQFCGNNNITIGKK